MEFTCGDVFIICLAHPAAVSRVAEAEFNRQRACFSSGLTCSLHSFARAKVKGPSVFLHGSSVSVTGAIKKYWGFFDFCASTQIWSGMKSLILQDSTWNASSWDGGSDLYNSEQPSRVRRCTAECAGCTEPPTWSGMTSFRKRDWRNSAASPGASGSPFGWIWIDFIQNLVIPSFLQSAHLINQLLSDSFMSLIFMSTHSFNHAVMNSMKHRWHRRDFPINFI